ncbi:SIS domain-containing protein [Streptomyces tsukubensis]|uniref:Glutamine--fructose-6-phosphate aminotransferase [isomerizing] n=1 Tax=Streptomyces tsukubensis TaxID=83656 RepID=A0A1V4AF73_9ACTN|nr:SIS domain-containing protein [Streptomyces tsukubensis]OON82716.1 sugar isomerase [Streptomyces tsukubensis]QFR92109.1 SIS domain-containing protein [Streptomyces tsukubensis]
MSSGVPVYGYSYEQGRAAQLTALREVIDHLPARLEEWRPRWRRVLLAGIGASNAALASPAHALRAAGIDAARTDCSDYPLAAGSPDAVLALSQSGRSRETADLVARFGAAGVPTVALTNAAWSPLRETAATTVSVGDYPDSRVSTVGFVVTYAALGMLADVLADGHVDPGWARVPHAVEETLADSAEPLAKFAAGPLAEGSVDIVASAPQLTTAEAVALLFREGPLVPASAYGTRTYLHGPMDVASPNTSHVLVGGSRELALAEQLLQQPTSVLTVTDGTEPVPVGVTPVTVPTGLTPPQRALVEVCVLQELVARTARARGNPVDDTAFTRQDTKIGALTEL